MFPSKTASIVSDPIALQSCLSEEGTVMALKGDMHKRFRNALNVGFTASAVRRCRPAFGEVAEEVSRQLEASNGSPVDICPMLGRATLTAISKAVLGCSAEDLGEDFVSAALNLVSTASNQSTGEQIIADAVSASLPEWLMLAMIRLPTPTFALLRRARALAQEIGERVVSEKRRAAQAGTDITGDLYGVLVDAAQAQAQTQMHLGRGARVLTDRELAEQTQMLMVAGQDTTANVLTFVLLELAKDPKLQNALRAEIRAHMHDAAEGNYDALPLLNAIIKETLRMYPVEPLTDRVALQDAVIPLGEPLTTIKAERISSIPIRKGKLSRWESARTSAADSNPDGALTPTNSSPPAGSRAARRFLAPAVKAKYSGPTRIYWPFLPVHTPVWGTFSHMQLSLHFAVTLSCGDSLTTSTY
ncbi:Cytochrome P450 [Mycena sanguinolenta]|uniref:Cytochrome P450 n=1 Tax=Mycena sanguinolenta TaxID=230812 RepID=A0A8H6XP61_9AGAR|nr:Cytochrome P450 [Mycena sanguinolenta]